ncbi:MAG: hypothetical protein H5U40_17740 [Polyangiaceae bacterium]|nr:hypothetical protein [Polyangiaceae bacterium]
MADGSERRDTTAEDEVRVRGVAFLNLLNAARVKGGVGLGDALLDRMPSQLASAIREKAFDPNAYRPVRELRDAHTALRDITGSGPEISREYARFVLEHETPLIFRVFLRSLTPDMLLPRAQGVFRRFYDRGELRILDRSRGSAVGEFRGCVGFNESLWLDVLGGCEGALIATGARDVRIAFVTDCLEGTSQRRLIAQWA